MSKTDLHPEALRHVRARRISTAADGKPPIDEEICVAREAAVVIDVENVGSYTVLCAPADKYEMVAGFLFSGRVTPFTALDPSAQDVVLREWRDSRLAVRRTGYEALRKLVLASYYSAPEVWPSMGYPGPPQLRRASP